MSNSTLTISYGFKDSIRVVITLILAVIIYFIMGSETDIASKVFSSCFLSVVSLLATFRHTNTIDKNDKSVLRKLSFWTPLITVYKKRYKYKSIDFIVIEKLGSRAGTNHGDVEFDMGMNDDAPNTFHAYLILDENTKVYLRPVDFSNWVDIENEYMDFIKN